VGGHLADPTKYPFFTWLNIEYDLSPTGSVFCGGTLIARDVVMTAAHCLNGFKNIDVWVNATSRKSSDYEYLRKSVRNVIHPKYQSSSYGNDIGLIFLDSPVNNVPLVQRNRNTSLPGNTRTLITAIGFGRISTSGNTPENLMEVTYFSVPKTECIKKLGSWFVHESEVCAGEGKKGTCYGDSGGPIFLPRKDSSNDMVQFGLTSRGADYDCPNKPNKPELLTDVAYFTKWIDDTICKYSKSKPKECSTRKPNTARPSPTKRLM
jgi:trypsin